VTKRSPNNLPSLSPPLPACPPAPPLSGKDYADFLTNLCYDHIVTATVRPNL
jgi:hypothetical protein